MTQQSHGHNQPRNDNTSTKRGRKRIADLNAIAASFGFPTWRKFETAVLNRYYEKMNSAKQPMEVAE